MAMRPAFHLLTAAILLTLAATPAGADWRAAFAKLDKDGDGRIAFWEFDSGNCWSFWAMDFDGDCFISPSEYAQASAARDVAADIAFAYLLRWDANRDGLLSREEFQGIPRAFVEADRDGNNVLHFAEVIDLVRSPGPIHYLPSRFMRARDLDGDGLITESEWLRTQGDPALFRAMDRNHNRVLSFDEVEDYLYRYERRLDGIEEAVRPPAGWETSRSAGEAPPGQSLRVLPDVANTRPYPLQGGEDNRNSSVRIHID